jgi:DNA-binding response OmpR family regulator
MKKILIVDDEEIMRGMLEQMVMDAGYEVFSANNCDQAIAACNNEHFDLIILDMVMPGKDGYLIVPELTRCRNKPKIIAISGGDRSFDGTTYLDLAKHNGAHKTFVKPFERREFLQAVDELIGGKKGYGHMKRNRA